MSQWKLKLIEEPSDYVWQSLYPWLPYNKRPFWFHYQQSYLNSSEKVKLVLISDQFGKMAAFPFTHFNQEFSLFGAPCSLAFSTQFEENDVVAIERILISWLESEYKDSKILLSSTPLMRKAFWSKTVSTTLIEEAYCDLSLSEELLWQGIRKSYRSLINGAKNKISLSVVNAANFSDKVFSDFKELHIKAAGRQTRSNESWDCQARQIKAGEGYLVIGYLEDKLVTGMFNLCDSKKAFYAVAASDRELMAQNIPLAHAPLWLSIIHAKEIGLISFQFGDVTNSEYGKLSDINAFKRGFSSHISLAQILKVQL